MLSSQARFALAINYTGATLRAAMLTREDKRDKESLACLIKPIRILLPSPAIVPYGRSTARLSM